MYKNSLINQKGFGLINVVVAAGILGVVALGVSKLGFMGAKIKKDTKNSFDIAESVGRIQKIFLDHESCSATVSPADPLAVGETKNLNSIKANIAGAEEDKFVVNQPLYPGSSITVTNIEITRESQSMANVRIRFQKSDNDNSYGVKEIERVFAVEVLYEATNNLDKCFSQFDNVVETSMAMMCEEVLEGQFVDGECTNSRVCDMEKKIMIMNGTPGTTSCGETISFQTTDMTIQNSGAFTIPQNIVNNSIEVYLVGGGGAGGGGDTDEGGTGGWPGQLRYDYMTLPPNANCSFSIGDGAPRSGRARSGGSGNTSIFYCNGAPMLVANGGRGGEEGKISGCGRPGNGLAIGNPVNISYSGGSGGCKRNDGRDGGLGSGGGGGGRRRTRGGAGGKGFAIVRYTRAIVN